ncbi:hypothetical protein [Brevundimonas lenta]|uniref:Uncharacterized protein n=1 Tax=Brevundimonas lenta TaxID=424796 RepID=A0A7W6JEJ1_9CAUL|nr:hypothetical protein [Brevundimonas lenta]MBB4083591.1 hypothetical protein [Brevundimonas lenta]
MFPAIRHRLCQHTSYWSERRKGYVCDQCGRFTPDLRPKSKYPSEIPGFRH